MHRFVAPQHLESELADVGVARVFVLVHGHRSWDFDAFADGAWFASTSMDEITERAIGEAIVDSAFVVFGTPALELLTTSGSVLVVESAQVPFRGLGARAARRALAPGRTIMEVLERLEPHAWRAPVASGSLAAFDVDERDGAPLEDWRMGPVERWHSYVHPWDGTLMWIEDDDADRRDARALRAVVRDFRTRHAVDRERSLEAVARVRAQRDEVDPERMIRELEAYLADQ